MKLSCGCEINSMSESKLCYIHEIELTKSNSDHECRFEPGYLVRYPAITSTTGSGFFDEYIVSTCRGCGAAVKKKVVING